MPRGRPRKVVKYEYYVQEFKIGEPKTVTTLGAGKAELDTMGALGWELVAVTGENIAVFKRILP